MVYCQWILYILIKIAIYRIVFCFKLHDALESNSLITMTNSLAGGRGLSLGSTINAPYIPILM